MPAFDPRVTPARPDLAAKYLEGKVDAARFVEGKSREVIEPQAPLRSAPRRDALLLTEALWGERMTIYEANGEGWAWGQLAVDGYVGWLPESAHGPPGAPATHKVAALRTLVFPGPSIKLPPLAALPLGSTLAIARVEDRLAVTSSGGYVPAVHLKPMGEYETDFVAVAERFTGVPYLWGSSRARARLFGTGAGGADRLWHCLPTGKRHAGGGRRYARRASPRACQSPARRSVVLEGPRRHRPRGRQPHPRQRVSHGGCHRTGGRRDRADSPDR